MKEKILKRLYKSLLFAVILTACFIAMDFLLDFEVNMWTVHRVIAFIAFIWAYFTLSLFDYLLNLLEEELGVKRRKK
jgi:hypothetical protein